MRSFGANDNKPLGNSGQGGSIRVTAGPHSLAFSGEIPWDFVQFLSEAFGEIEGALKAHWRTEADAAKLKAENDNFHAQRIAESRKKGRIGSSSVRRLQRAGFQRREAISELAALMETSANDLETLISLHNKRRDAFISRLRHKLLTRWNLEGLSRKDMAARLNVQPQHISRLLKGIKAQKEGELTN